ncbi:MAG: hypothetical protein FWE89_05135, partial [Syntrophaceae bacterium]|nr:hypothetical protein [Syntrophaceae bacterium]
AYIQPKPGTRVSADDILAFLREHKASVLHLPERIEMIESMPLTKADKIDKEVLRQDIGKKIGRQGGDGA